MKPKFIIVAWVPEQEFGYEFAMRVVSSTHPRFSEGTRFDYGFFNIATREGYMIQSFPPVAERKTPAIEEKGGQQ